MGPLSGKGIIFIALLLVILIAPSAFAQGPPTNYCIDRKVCLDLIFNDTGALGVRVCAGTNESLNVSDFNFWYNGTHLNVTNNGIMYAFWADSDIELNFSNATLFNNETSPPCVDITLNSTQGANFTFSQVQVNLTVNGSNVYTPPTGPDSNSTMETINYVVLNVKDGGGSAVANAAFKLFDNSTKAFVGQELAATDGKGYWAEQCFGIVNGTACVGEPGWPNNRCSISGGPFCSDPDCYYVCQINSTVSVYAFDFISSNISAVTNIMPGTPSTATLNIPSAISIVNAQLLMGSPQDGPSFANANITLMEVYDYYTGAKEFSLQNITSGEQGLFLRTNTLYNISITNVTFNDLPQGSYNYTVMLPSTGIVIMEMIVSNSSQRATIYGKVVNETGSPVVGAVVYAQMHKSSAGGGLMFFSSSVTGQNGLFSVGVPQTQHIPSNEQCQQCDMYWPVYQFMIASNVTSGTGAPMYFQSVDNNDGRGYFAQGNVMYLPKPLVLRSGGQANVNVTLNGAFFIVSEVAKLLSLGTGVTKDAVTGKLSIPLMPGFSTAPSIIVPFFSPTGSVIIDLMGKDGDTGSVINACFTNTSVSQGQVSAINCNMTPPGNLSIRAMTCSNLFDGSSCSQKMAGSFDFWFETNGILKDSGGNAVLYLSPEGTIISELLGFSSGGSISTEDFTLPLPPGNYTLEMTSSQEWSRYLGMYNRTTFEILPDQVTNFDAILAEAWRINPMFNPSMILSGNNNIEASVDYMSAGQLNDTRVAMSAQVLYLNKSAASGVVGMAFNGTTRRFENKTFSPLSMGLTAGKYLLLLNATNVTGNTTFMSTMITPVYAYDFQLGMDLGGFSFGTNQTVRGRIFAFNQTGSIPGNTSPIIVGMYDSNGAVVDLTGRLNLSSIVNGTGSIGITMPTAVGSYSILTKVNSSGRYGVSDQWVQVTNLNIQVRTDRFSYQAGDNVALTVKVLNASNCVPIANASVEVTVEGSSVSTPATGFTDSSGVATITLSPSVYGNWSWGWHNLRIKISAQIGGDAANLETWTGFDVRGMEVNIRPNRPSYAVTDEVVLDMFSPPEPAVTVVSAKVDGQGWTENPDLNHSNVANYSAKVFGLSCIGDCNVSRGKIINFSTGWGPGHHNVEIKLSVGQGTQNFYTGFDVNTYNIFAMTDRFSYDVNQNITLNVTVAWPSNGSAIAGIPVVATLYKAQPPNDIFVTNASNTTDAFGKVTMKLNATQSGFSYIKINASNQLWFIGVQVSSLSITLRNETNGTVTNNEYTATPGTAAAICTYSAIGGAPVPDGSTIKAYLWSYGRQTELSSNTTTGGFACIRYTAPADAHAQIYGLEVRVSTSAGDTGSAPPAALRISGGTSLQLRVSADRSFMQPYMPGESAMFTAFLTYTDGSPVSGRVVSFTYGSEGSVPQTVGNATTGNDGAAKLAMTAPAQDGPYYLLASVPGTEIQSYSGFVVSSLNVRVTPNATEYKPGDTMGLNITVTNRSSGAAINSTGGFVAVFNKEKGKRDIAFTPSGSQPYLVSVSIPNEKEAVGSYPIGAVVFSDRLQGSGFTLVDVVNASQQINISTSVSPMAGTPFNVTINASSGSTAHVVVFSPSASAVVYDSDVALSGTPPSANITRNLSYAGMYVVGVFVKDVGSKTKIVTVAPPTSGTVPNIWTYTSATDSTTNTTVFATSDNVFIMSNIPNATANVMRINSTTNTTISTALPLNQYSSGKYYAQFSTAGSNLVSGMTYFVRLDTSTASGVATTMFRVS
jgi:hypothetical protein